METSKNNPDLKSLVGKPKLSLVSPSWDNSKQWQDLAQESFFNMVNVPDGDFEAIAHLSNTLNDPDSLQMMVEILSRQQFLQPLED
jgi:ubiquinone biosynthesis protein Coq4